MKPPLWERMLEPDKVWCECGAEGEPDTCPYQQEINGESEVCTCCQTCRDNCKEDV